MKRLKQTSLAFATATGVLIISLSPASASALEEGPRVRHGGQGRAGMNPEHRLITPEMREQFREQNQDISEEEQVRLREARQARRDEVHHEMEAFVGLSSDEMQNARKSGQSMGDILAAQGKTEADAETFLTAQAQERVDMISEQHELTAEQQGTLQERIANFVQDMLARWFNK